MNWKLIAFVLFGALVGAITGPMHPLEWNRPTHYTELASCFFLFPVAFLFITLTEKTSKAILILGLAMMIPYLPSWQIMHRVLHGRFFDDVLWMWPIVTGIYILSAILLKIAITKLKNWRGP